MIAGYKHFVGLATRLRWDADAIDLHGDAVAWPRLAPTLRAGLLELLAGFCVGEARVAEELAPFAAAADDRDAVACFEAQAADEARHARFFDRVAGEVAGVPGADPAQRQAALRPFCDPAFVELFERRLPETAAALAAGAADLATGVALYHMVLEGVVFSAGQFALLDLLTEAPELSGTQRGVELVLRDERWHIGFGSRCLSDADLDPERVSQIVLDGERATAAWSSVAGRELRAKVTAIHHRRLATIRAGDRHKTIHLRSTKSSN